jgi:hypothetical protein
MMSVLQLMSSARICVPLALEMSAIVVVWSHILQLLVVFSLALSNMYLMTRSKMVLSFVHIWCVCSNTGSVIVMLAWRKKDRSVSIHGACTYGNSVAFPRGY